MTKAYQVIDRPPSFQEYVSLCESVGWELNFSVAEKAIRHSLYAAVISDGENIVGMARVVGDGAMYFYIQDFVIHPDHQRNGAGKLLMEKLFSYLKEHAPSPAFIGLFSTEAGSGLYEQFGFHPRDLQGMFRLTPID